MKKILVLILILSCICISGCWSLPRVANYKELYSFTKEEKNMKGGFGSKRKVVLVKDFRGNEVYDEDMAALQEKVEKYISSHADLNEPEKNKLRELRVSKGTTKEEVLLLLGKPDKVIRLKNKVCATSEIWIYRTNKRIAFVIIVIPVFFTHEGYYLYFEENILRAIERHSLEETVTTSGIGLFERPKKE